MGKAHDNYSEDRTEEDGEWFSSFSKSHKFSNEQLRKIFTQYKIGTLYRCIYGKKLPEERRSIRVFMIGETHAGKSSTINHFFSAREGHVYRDTMADVGESTNDGNRVPTTAYPMRHLLFMGRSCGVKNALEIWDPRGFIDQSSSLESIPAILGKQDPSFQPPRGDHESAIQYHSSRSQQTEQGRFHLALVVVPRNASPEAIEYYRKVKSELAKERIPALWILTKNDCAPLSTPNPMLLIGVKDSEYLTLENYPENYIGDLCPEKTRQALTILLYIVLRAELRGLDVEDLSKLQIVKQGLLHETPKIAKEGFEILDRKSVV